MAKMTSGQLIDAAKEGKTLIKVRDMIDWGYPSPNLMEVKVERGAWHAYGWFSAYFTQKEIILSIVESPEEWRIKPEPDEK
jgi:hypothetical protein